MKERLQKILSARGEASRRAADRLITAGRVTVNGQTAVSGMKADPDYDEIKIDGRPIRHETKRVVVMLNKPRGYITSMSDQRGRKTVIDLLGAVPERVYPVGRLDMDSEGLLLLTNDGQLANLLMHPSNRRQKTYMVTVSGVLSDQVLEKLRKPIEIDGRMTRPAVVQLMKSDMDGGVVSVIICEGRNRQVRRLCESAGLKVKRLKRVSYGPLELGNLKNEKWRYLTDDEIEKLRSIENCKSASIE
jgi:23S rRNA pseudouridine2605 synthase